MRLARKAGLYNVWVSNGYTSPAPARKAARYMDAINVDLKGDIAFYRSLCAVPDEKPMHAALKIYKSAGVWIELTTLVIPGKNDRPEIIDGIVKWVKKNLGSDTPMHFSRFFPHFRMKDIQPTPVETLRMASATAKKCGMKYVYVGNIAGEGEDTVCPKCGGVVIERHGYSVQYKRACPKCKTAVKIAGTKWIR
jgi:pyruvate formate lyase activating enzyme